MDRSELSAASSESETRPHQSDNVEQRQRQRQTQKRARKGRQTAEGRTRTASKARGRDDGAGEQKKGAACSAAVLPGPGALYHVWQPRSSNLDAHAELEAEIACERRRPFRTVERGKAVSRRVSPSLPARAHTDRVL
ncbi:hypothetical protein PYCCODRAFT_510538 [Trametes coccinea BRFM310]|uniref:Uncharacterized protein n=1 Tax=Trametes coccinea (strain BRFM310) TaxID=1353009 RepID=A0A1Y2IJX3_TRAC3|nr:hypothetical protein PYCCODRAFT_510538 [Trametes coccinea BRFM310]